MLFLQLHLNMFLKSLESVFLYSFDLHLLVNCLSDLFVVLVRRLKQLSGASDEWKGREGLKS